MSLPAAELEAAVTLSRLPGVGARGFIDLIRNHGLPSAALTVWLATEASRPNRRAGEKPKQAGPVEGWAERARQAGATAAWAGGPGYPARLLDLTEPPPVVFMRGAWLESSAARRLCVVGARRASPEALECLRRLIRNIAATERANGPGWEIISGAAVGIDAAAHRAALENGLRTSAVLANGIDIAYPACNKALIEEIAGSGGLLTELLPGAPPRRSFFPTRNRLLAALADAILVVQAGETSGSLITAKWAAKLGRPLFAVVPPAETPDWFGNNTLLAAGAIPLEPSEIHIDMIISNIICP